MKLTQALLCQFLTARSIIGVALRPLKLTVTEWTESRNWTESTETYGAKRSAQAQLSLGKRTGTRLAANLPRSVTRPASPGRYLAKTAAIADRDLLLPKTGRVVLGASARSFCPICSASSSSTNEIRSFLLRSSMVRKRLVAAKRPSSET